MKSPPTKHQEFSRLIREYSAIINKVSYFYANDYLPFDDLRQEIYVNLWKSLPQFHGECKISTWIYRVAVNSALMTLRSSKPKLSTVPIDFSQLNITTEFADTLKESLQALYTSINSLDEIEKAIILLWLDEYSYEEIATTLGLKRNTVATKIHRIKNKLSKSI